MTRRPHVLAHVHLYPPGHNAGAEWMLHAILTRLHTEHGFSVQVLTNRPPRRRNVFDGIPVEMARDQRSQARFYRPADVVITHLDATRQAMFHARRAHKPLAHLVHNDAQLRFHQVTPERAQLVVWNSQWIADAHPDWAGESMVVFPPVWSAGYQLNGGQPGDAVMLLNLSPAKGAALFYELARRMPEVPFIGVRGSYGTQVDPPADLTNVAVLANQADVRKAYQLARIIVMPSSYESWGRVAVEAGAAGIPTVASCTPGLLECGVPVAHLPVDPEPDGTLRGLPRSRAGLGTADLWEAELRRLLQPDTWAVEAVEAQRRALRLEAISHEQVDTLANKLRALAG